MEDPNHLITTSASLLEEIWSALLDAPSGGRRGGVMRGLRGDRDLYLIITSSLAYLSDSIVEVTSGQQSSSQPLREVLSRASSPELLNQLRGLTRCTLSIPPSLVDSSSQIIYSVHPLHLPTRIIPTVYRGVKERLELLGHQGRDLTPKELSHSRALSFRLTPTPALNWSALERQRCRQILTSARDCHLFALSSSGALSFYNWVAQEPQIELAPAQGVHSSQALPRGWRWLSSDPSVYQEGTAHWVSPICRVSALNEGNQGGDHSSFSHHEQSTLSRIITTRSLAGQVTLLLDRSHRLYLNEPVTQDTERLFDWVPVADISETDWTAKWGEVYQDEAVTPEEVPTKAIHLEALNDSRKDSGRSMKQSVKSMVRDTSRPLLTPHAPPSSITPSQTQPKGSLVNSSNVGEPFVVDYSAVLSAVESDSSTIRMSVIDREDDNASKHTINEEVDPPSKELTEEHTQDVLRELDLELNAVRDLINIDDLDESEVIDISLSELPVERLATEQSVMIDQEVAQLSPPPSMQMLSIDREISALNPSMMKSLVTFAEPISPHTRFSSDSPRIEDQETISQSYPHNSEIPPGTRTRAGKDISSYHRDEATVARDQPLSAALPDDDLDDVPTRVDLDVRHVSEALKQSNPQSYESFVHSPMDLNSEPTQTFERGEETERELGESAREALSREHTARLKVRDFEMLTDIKELPAQSEPESTRPHPTVVAPVYEEPHHDAPTGIQSDQPTGASPSLILSPTSRERSQPIPPPQRGNYTQRNTGGGVEYQIKEVQQNNEQRKHSKRRSFSDVIRSLTAKNKPD